MFIFTKQGTESFVATECSESSENITITTRTKPVRENDQSTDTVNSNATPMLLASGERVLQIASVPIQREDGSITVMVRVLLDSASQRTFMTDRLAKQLKLVPEHRESLSVSTFGAEKITGNIK